MFVSPSHLNYSLLGSEFAVETPFLSALLPIEILVKAENSVENVPEIMNYPAVLEKDKSQASVSSSFCIPSSYGECEMTHITSSTI